MKHKIIFAITLLGGLFVLTACEGDLADVDILFKPDKPFTTSFSGYKAEDVAAAVPPNANCPFGRVNFSTGSFGATVPLIGGDLKQGNPTNNNAPVLPAPPGIGANEFIIGDDNQIIRLRNGDLLMLQHGYTWSNLPDPKPIW